MLSGRKARSTFPGLFHIRPRSAIHHFQSSFFHRSRGRSKVPITHHGYLPSPVWSCEVLSEISGQPRTSGLSVEAWFPQLQLQWQNLVRYAWDGIIDPPLFCGRMLVHAACRRFPAPSTSSPPPTTAFWVFSFLATTSGLQLCIAFLSFSTLHLSRLFFSVVATQNPSSSNQNRCPLLQARNPPPNDSGPVYSLAAFNFHLSPLPASSLLIGSTLLAE